MLHLDNTYTASSLRRRSIPAEEEALVIETLDRVRAIIESLDEDEHETDISIRENRNDFFIRGPKPRSKHPKTCEIDNILNNPGVYSGRKNFLEIPDRFGRWTPSEWLFAAGKGTALKEGERNSPLDTWHTDSDWEGDIRAQAHYLQLLWIPRTNQGDPTQVLVPKSKKTQDLRKAKAITVLCGKKGRKLYGEPTFAEWTPFDLEAGFCYLFPPGCVHRRKPRTEEDPIDTQNFALDPNAWRYRLRYDFHNGDPEKHGQLKRE